MPDGFLFDDRKALVTRNIVYAYSNGLNIQVSRYLGNLFRDERYRDSLEKKEQGVRHIAPYYITTIPTDVAGSAFSKRIQIIGPKVHLEIVLSGHVERVSETERVIDGLRFRGKNLSENEGPVAAKEIDVDDLKRSDAISRALKKKPGKIERDISYEIKSNNSDTPENPIDTQNAIVLDIPSPGRRFTMPPRILIQLRADGEVGDMVVYSSKPTKELEKFVEAASKVKFVPAIRDGKTVDTWTTVTFPVTFFIR